MISRKSTRLLSELYEVTFREYHRGGSYSSDYYTIDSTKLYDFLFDNGYAGYFCNAARATSTSRDTRALKDFLMQLHTGESLILATKDWSWEQREKLGQRYLHDLAEDILNHWTHLSDNIGGFIVSRTLEKKVASDLKSHLEIDGYAYKNDRLLESEAEILDIKAETGLLEDLHSELQLQNNETAFHHLKLTEDHYVEERWDDSISNSRKYLESVLQEVAATHSSRIKGNNIAPETYSRPVRVRDYLHHEGLLETKEKDALSSIYGLLSNTGGHPYMAQRDQARLLRHLALTLAQFVMLRLRGVLQSPEKSTIERKQ